MKCPKCQGRVLPDLELSGEITSYYCQCCGYRQYRDFKVRPPAVTECNGEGPRLNDQRRIVTPAERAIISAKKAEGMTHQQIATLIKRPVGTISKIIQTMRQEARNHA